MQFKSCGIALAIILISACTSTPSANVSSASANLIGAQANATIASQDATRAAAEAQARLQEQYTRATQQAAQAWQEQQLNMNATQQAQAAQYNATQQAQESAVSAAMIEQARANATASAQRQQAENAAAWMQVTAQAQQIAATQIVVDATATKIAKEIANAPLIADFDALLTEGLKLFAVLFIFVTGIVALRKWQAKDIIQQPHADGPAFYIKHGLLAAPDPNILWNPYEEKSKWLQLPAPESDDEAPPPPPPIGDDEIKLMYKVQKWVHASIDFAPYIDQLGAFHNAKHDHGYNGRQLLTARECVAVRVFASNAERDRAATWLQSKRLGYGTNNNSGFYTWETLSSVLLAVNQALAPHSPGNAVIDQENDTVTLRDTEHGVTGSNTDNTPSQANNTADRVTKTRKQAKFIPSDPIALSSAVSSLPELDKKRSATT